LLDQAWQHHLTLVVAPAGAGKTTALRQFASRHEHVAWCSADALEISPDGCVAHIARVLSRTLGRQLDGSSAGALLDAIDAWPGTQVALVIDDLYAITSTTAETDLGLLLHQARGKLVTVAGTRAMPEFDLSRLQVGGELLMVTGDDLRFRTWEADRLFREHYDVFLSTTDVELLVNRLEGWAAGLHLYHLAVRDRPVDVRRRLIGDATRLGRDYLARNVLSGLAPDLLSFLTATAALPVLTPSLCNQLTGRADAVEMLDHLERNQLFTIAIDQRGTYRYHEVLRGYIDVRLQEREGPVGVAARHRHVGELLEYTGRTGEALQAYSRAGAWDAVSRLVLDGEQHRDAGDEWIELIPVTIVENDPNLLLARARQRLRNGRISGGLRDYERAAATATTVSMMRLCESEHDVFAGWYRTDVPAPTGWMAPIHAAAVGADVSPRQAALDRTDVWAALGGALASLVALDTDRATDELTALLGHPLLDGRSATLTELGLLLAGAVEPILAMLDDPGSAPSAILDPRRIEATIEGAEQSGLGWVARIAHAATALTFDAEGIKAARLVRSACAYDGDRWGAALAALFEGVGSLTHGQADREPLDVAATDLTELGAAQLAVIATRLAALADDRQQFDDVHPSDHIARVLAVMAPQTPSGGVPVGLRCFGSIECVIDGRRLDLTTLRPRALSVLRVLALHAGQAVHRETIMDALWRDSPPDAARRGLQVAISSVRQAMPVRAELRIVRRGEAYELVIAPGAFFDVGTFRTALTSAMDAVRAGDDADALARATVAVDLYRGDLLLDEGPADWIVTPRENLRLDLVRAASVAGEAAMRLGNPRAAIRPIERGLAVDRYAGSLWELLLAAHEQVGDRAALARARHAFDEAMADLGV
jgi:DNA-binding SARP family transcriptional activator